MNPCYVVLEGGDGTGKSTQAQLLVEALRADGTTVTHVREPGTTPLGETLRQLLLHGEEIDAVTEALLFSAARRELLAQIVRPALARGECVIAERSFLSTLVYQGVAPAGDEDRAPFELLLSVTAEVHRGIWPDAVLLLDLAADEGRGRLTPRAALDRIETRGGDWAERVRDGFRAVIEREDLHALVPRDRIHLVDASRPVATIHADLARLVADCRGSAE